MRIFAMLATLGLMCAPHAFGATFNADDLAGPLSQIDDYTTLRWLNGTNLYETVVVAAVRPGLTHAYFSNAQGSPTADLVPGLLNEGLGSPSVQSYSALEIDFATPVTSFAFQAENHSSSPFTIALYDSADQFISLLGGIGNPQRLEETIGTSNPIFHLEQSFNFTNPIGKIRIGGQSDAGYIYEISVSAVPEPSSALLIALGLGFMGFCTSLKKKNPFVRNV